MLSKNQLLILRYHQNFRLRRAFGSWQLINEYKLYVFSILELIARRAKFFGGLFAARRAAKNFTYSQNQQIYAAQ